ncbi:MAG: hypothetical protein IH950_06175 [Bacteroidetes bacterium]|nr:hypothetical protein [Bacteroidota bacterium]
MKTPILIDFDGVIKLGNNPAPDAGEFLNFILENNIPSYIISNSTLQTGKEITQFLVDNKLPSKVPAMTAVDATLQYVKEHYKKVSNIFLASVSASVLFFVTNFAVWVSGIYYPKDLSGLAASYTAAIPFFHYTLLGDLFFVTLMFGSYELAKAKYPQLAEVKV